MKIFTPYRLDSTNQCLWRGDERVTITPKAFDVLRYLVEHAGRLVTHEEILEALWPKTYVNQEVVKKYILGIRKVLGDRRHDPVFIETFPRRGYQFVAPVVDEAEAPQIAPRLDGEMRMVGRDAALATLDACLERALHGQRQIVFVTGEPGIGKTTLVDGFQQRAARARGVRVARGQCVEGFGGKEAYYPMLEALGRLAQDRDGPRSVQVLAARAPTWLIQFPSLLKAGQREALQRDTLGATRERMVREICEALEALTAENALALVLEDLHWGDPSTLDVISALARRREAAKLVLLGTYRPHDAALVQIPLRALKRDLQVHNLCQEVALARLATSDITQYLAKEFDGVLPPDLATLLHRHSGGNPLFMVALVEEIRKRRLLADDHGHWRFVASPDEIDLGVPETLQQMLEAQLEQLSALEQQVLSSASVAGERFSVWLVSAALDVASDRIEDLYDGLAERRQFIKSAGMHEIAGGLYSACYEFSHSLYREGVYQRLSDSIRSRLHRKVAQRLESLCTADRPMDGLDAELARHFEYGGEYSHAIRHLVIAAQNVAAGRFAYRDAIRILQRALELAAKLAPELAAREEARIRELIGDAHYALGAMDDSAKSYKAAAAIASRAGLDTAQVNALSSLVRPLGLIDPDRGIAAIERAEQVSARIDDSLLVARTRMLAAATRLLYDTWCNEDAELCSSAQAAVRRAGGELTPSYHNMMFGHVEVLKGNYRSACDIFDIALSNSGEPPSLIAHLFALSGKTVALLRSGRFGEVLRIIRDGKQMAAKNGNDPWLFNFREAWLRTLAWDFDGASRVCDAILATRVEYPTGQPQTIARLAQGYAELARGNNEAAIERFAAVRDPRVTPKFFLHWAWRMTAQLGLSEAWLSSGNLSNARRECEILLRSALATADPHLQALALDMNARLEMRDGNWTAARERLDQALPIVAAFTVPVAAWQVHETASRWHAHAGDMQSAEASRAAAAAHIVAIADSLRDDEPLCDSFLAAPPVRRILG